MLRCLVALVAAFAIGSPAVAAKKPRVPPPPPSYGPRDDVRAFAAGVAERHGLETAWIVKQVAQARKVETVQRLMMPAPAGVAKNWAAYRDRFVEPRRIAAGAAFWKAHEAWLGRAEQRWGVPPEIVVGIVGVETFYGRITGGFRVIDALATLSFDFPTGRKDRSPFFRDELEQFLVWCARERIDPQVPKGSFAGAMGLPQFMPGSVNRYAVDFDGDGRIDLATSAADAIGSVAHYLAEHGWQRGLPPTFDVQPPDDEAQRTRLLGPDIVPSFSAAQFGEAGAQLADAGRRHDGALALVLLENGGAAPSYVAGTRNFYALTRYNWSSYYAMAVISLGQAVGLAVGHAPPTAPVTAPAPEMPASAPMFEAAASAPAAVAPAASAAEPAASAPASAAPPAPEAPASAASAADS